MAKTQPPPISVKDVVYKLQLSLLHGVRGDDQLFAAGSIISRSDYSDVVTERSIAALCGYPLCPNPLPSDRPRRKGRYRISLKEHKVYDLHETYMYCSSDCLINSRAFGASLKEERVAVLDSARIEAVLAMFGDDRASLEREVGFGKDGDLGISKLRIEERSGKNSRAGEVSLEQWVGPSNAIEGYVPRRDRRVKQPGSKSLKRGSKGNDTILINDMDFVSTIITEDEYTVSKLPSSSSQTSFDVKLREPEVNLAKNSMENQFTVLETSCTPAKRDSKGTSRQIGGENSKTLIGDKLVVQETSTSSQGDSHLRSEKSEEESIHEMTEKLTELSLKSSLKTSRNKKLSRSVTWADEKTDGAGGRKLCEVRSIDDVNGGPFILGKTNGENTKSSGEMKSGRSIVWANEKGDSSRSMDVCEVGKMGDMKEASDPLHNKEAVDSDDFVCFASAEACASALNEASRAVASEEFEVNDAMSKAGIIILPRPEDVNEPPPVEEEDDISEPEQAPIKWPKKPGSHQSDVFNPEDSWFDTPPDGFSLTLSTFAKVWNALFSWTTSSTLAYIYGRDESLHEEYLLANGRDYPQKIILGDGRSSEIKQALAGSLARALPGLVADLRLPTPVSSLEQGMGRLLETMSFVDALPPLRMKQWQVIVLLFIEALSVYRLLALTPHLTSRSMLFHKVLDGAQISVEEYEVMKDLMIPLGRTPHFSSQSGA